MKSAPIDFSKQMYFSEHLEELRQRLLLCAGVFGVGFFVCFWQADVLLAFLRKPLFDVLSPEQRKLYFTGLFEAFFVHLKIASYGSCLLFSPFYSYQLWAFIAPGLKQAEKRVALFFWGMATLFFLAGAAFAYGVLFPVGFRYFVHFGNASDMPLLTLDAYYSTALKLLLLFGLAFELPVGLCGLGFLGIVDATLLKSQRRVAIIGITVVSALITPPDFLSMMMLGVPLVLFYEGSIWMLEWMPLLKKRRESQKEWIDQPSA